MKKRFLLSALFIAAAMTAFASPESERDAFINAAKAYIGTPYVYGGTSKAGIDCSGLIYMAARNSGVKELPRTAALMYQATTRITDAERQKGDLVFFKAGSTVSHVGIFLGAGKFLHAPSDGPVTGVQVGRLSERYWERTYYGAGRFLPAMKGGSSSSSSSSSSRTSSSSRRTSGSSSRSSSSSRNKRKPKTHFAADVSGNFNWSFLAPNGGIGFIPQGGGLMGEIRTDLWLFDPGIFFGANYVYLPDGDFAKSLEFPVGLSLAITDYIDVYAGAVFCASPEAKKLPYADYKVNTVTFPGIFGVKFMTPAINMGAVSLVFNQDISFTPRISADSSKDLSFTETLGSGLSFSTGVTVRFKF